MSDPNFIDDYLPPTQRLIYGDQHGRALSESYNSRFAASGVDLELPMAHPAPFYGGVNIQGADGAHSWRVFNKPSSEAMVVVGQDGAGAVGSTQNAVFVDASLNIGKTNPLIPYGTESGAACDEFVYIANWDYPMQVFKIDSTTMQVVGSCVVPNTWAPTKWGAVAPKSGKLYFNSGFDNTDDTSIVAITKIDIHTMTVEATVQLPSVAYDYGYEDLELVLVDPEEQYVYTSSIKVLAHYPHYTEAWIIVKLDARTLAYVDELILGEDGDTFTPTPGVPAPPGYVAGTFGDYFITGFIGTSSGIIIGDFMYLGGNSKVAKVDYHSMSLVSVIDLPTGLEQGPETDSCVCTDGTTLFVSSFTKLGNAVYAINLENFSLVNSATFENLRDITAIECINGDVYIYDTDRWSGYSTPNIHRLNPRTLAIEDSVLLPTIPAGSPIMRKVTT